MLYIITLGIETFREAKMTLSQIKIPQDGKSAVFCVGVCIWKYVYVPPHMPLMIPGAKNAHNSIPIIDKHLMEK